MSRLAACLQRAVGAGKISQAVAGKINGRVEELLAKGYPPQLAMAKASFELAAETAEKKRQTALRILAAARNESLVKSHPNGIAAGVLSLLARDLSGKATYSNVEARARAIRGLAHAGLVDVLDRFRAKYLGLFRDQAGLEDFVAAVYGRAPKDPAITALAKAWEDTTDRLLDRFIAAGGSKATRRNDWRLPQAWDAAKVRAVSRDAFISWMEDEHAAGRLSVRDPDTGLELDPLERLVLFEEAYDRIASEGLSDLVPGAGGGQMALANRRTMSRAFVWTSPEAYLGFTRRFGVGEGNLYDLLMGHIDGMSRDIAMLEILGPNPDWMVRDLRDLAVKDAGPVKAGHWAWRIDSTWAQISGAANTPVNEWVAGFFREARAFMTAAKLGSAVISSVSDFATMRQVAAWNGLPSVGWMRDYLRLLNPANAEDRRIAVRAGLIAEAWAQRAAGAMRHQADVIGTGLGSKAADFVMRASGLSAHTQAARWAIGMEMLGALAEHAAKPYGALPEYLRAGLGRYGIDAATWDVLRAAGVTTMGGWTILSPEAVARAVPQGASAAQARAQVMAATRLLEFVQSESRFAVPETTAAERSWMVGETRPGSPVGEFVRIAMQFKAFPIAVMTMHIGRGLNQARLRGKAAYLASFAIGTTLMGALALQLKQLSQGRDPRDMDDHRFWGAAVAQGGGAGILGDFMYTAVTRADQSFFANTFGGPVGGLVDDLWKVFGLNMQALDDERRERAIGADLSNLLRRNAPGTSLWYSRLVMDRLLWDELQRFADPDADRRFRRLERRMLREYDQEFWWAPGEAAPRRAPELERAIGGGP